MHEYIWQNSIRTFNSSETVNNRINFLELEVERLRNESELLQKQLLQYQHQAVEKDQKKGSSGSLAQAGNQSDLLSKNKKTFSLKLIAVVGVTFIICVLIFFFYLNSNHENAVDIPPKQNIKIENSTNEKVSRDLRNAGQFLNDNKVVEAMVIYSSYAKQEVPEAMYMYAKLALQNVNKNISCTEAFELLKKASAKKYPPAKRTLGFLYAYGNNKEVLQQANYFDRCTFTPNLLEGSKLLMEAMLQGDSSAARLLDELEAKNGQ